VASPAAVANGLQPDGTWAFIDDRGVTTATASMPVRVIADVNVAGALWDFGVRPVEIFGWNITGPDSVGPAGGNLDPSTVTFLNDASSTIDVEKALTVDPDLIVSLYFGEQYGVWSILPEDVARVEQIAPIVALSGITRADVAMGRFAELAGALGIDLESPEIAAQRAAYETSVNRLTGVLSAKPGMSALFIAPDTASIYVANPDAAGDVMLFRDLGLDVPKLPVAPGEYWQQLSLEEAGMYQTDLLFYSMRGTLASKEEVMAHPTLGLLPAAKAGQVFPWNQDVILNYPGVAASLDAVSSAVETSDPNIA
jgi:iron complex transport system substrate-binding protein